MKKLLALIMLLIEATKHSEDIGNCYKRIFYIPRFQILNYIQAHTVRFFVVRYLYN